MRLGIIGSDMVSASDGIDCLFERGFVIAVDFPEFLDERMLAVKLRKKQMLDRHVFIIHVLLVFAGIVKHVLDIGTGIRFDSGSGFDGVFDKLIDLLTYSFDVNVEFL